MSGSQKAYHHKGWLRFGPDPSIAAWVAAARPLALASLRDPAHAGWWRCGGTWFVGVNALANNATGAVAGSAPLAGRVVDFVTAELGAVPVWDCAQISAVLPGYPALGTDSDAAHAFRLRRDAAHVDGLHRVGPAGRRMLREPHAFILGLPLTDAGPDASPLVVWEGSHRIMRARLGAVLRAHAVSQWPQIDLTAAYHAARREVFERCARVAVPARPGEAYVIHRLALHGVAPWKTGPAGGRHVAYFRPPLENWRDWLS